MLIAVVGLVLGGCMASPLMAQGMSADEMGCCASKPCTQANQDHDCCKRMTAQEDQQFKAENKIIVNISLDILAPVVSSEIVPAFNRVMVPRIVDADQHGPPLALYKTHHSFLI